MKIIYNCNKLLFAILAMVIVLGCDDDNEVELTLPPSHSIVESSHQYAGNAIQIDNEISFADVSIGVVSRTWSLPEGVAASVLKLDKDVSNVEEIRQALRNRENLTEQEIEELEAQLRIGDESILPDYKEPILKLSFPNAGVYDLTLRQEFEVNPFVDDEVEPIDSNIVERVFTITVSDPIRFTNVQGTVLNEDGSLGDNTFVVANSALAEVEAGQTVRYTFDISGSVDEISVDAGGGVVVPESLVYNAEQGTGSVDVKYASISNYSLILSAIRLEPEGERTIEFINTVSVIPSTAPFVLSGSVFEQSDERISVPFNGEFAAVSGDISANFTVKLFDEADAFVRDLGIASVSNNPDDLTLLDITLSEPIYSTDNIKVSYDGNADIASVDSRTPVAFTDEAVVMYAPNLIDSDIADGATSSWTIIDANGSFEITDERAFTGTTSIKITKVDQDGNFRIRIPFPSGLTVDLSKQYVTSARVFVDSSVETPGGLKVHFFGTAPWWALNQNLSNFDKGEWVLIDQIRDFPKESYASFDIRVDGTANTTIYLDDLYIGEYEKRP